MMNKIHAITAIQNVESLSHSRTFGFFFDKEKAIEAVMENKCDIHECYYIYVVIETIEEGIHHNLGEEIWFKWNNKNGYTVCQKPKELESVYCYGMG
jgi:hypothetical protein